MVLEAVGAAQVALFQTTNAEESTCLSPALPPHHLIEAHEPFVLHVGLLPMAAFVPWPASLCVHRVARQSQGGETSVTLGEEFLNDSSNIRKRAQKTSKQFNLKTTLPRDGAKILTVPSLPMGGRVFQ